MKINRKNVDLISCFIVLLLGGCSSAPSRQLDQKLSQEPEVADSSVLSQKMQTLIEQDSKLTSEQKMKLTEIREETTAKLKGLRSQSLRLRAILIRDFDAENDQEIELIHSRLQDLNTQQLTLLFYSIKKANKVVGHIFGRKEFLDAMSNFRD